LKTIAPRIVALLTLLVLSGTAFAVEVRKPAFSGTFYPEKYSELSKTIKKYLDGVPSQKMEGDLLGLIVPHAGYD